MSDNFVCVCFEIHYCVFISKTVRRGYVFFLLSVDRVSVPSPIAIDILMDTMARDRVPMYLFSV